MAASFPSDPQSRANRGYGASGGQIAYAALGSNIGDREAMLLGALRLLHTHPRITVERVSRVYETDPVGVTEQPAFLNMAAQLRTVLEPLPLLREMLAIEHRLGRVRDVRWGPRTIDLDLLLYEERTMDTGELTLPHPRMMERAFVLVPLGDVLEQASPHYEAVSAAGRTALAERKEGITVWNTINWPSASALSES